MEHNSRSHVFDEPGNKKQRPSMKAFAVQQPGPLGFPSRLHFFQDFMNGKRSPFMRQDRYTYFLTSAIVSFWRFSTNFPALAALAFAAAGFMAMANTAGT